MRYKNNYKLRYTPEDLVVDPATTYLYGNVPEKLYQIAHAVACRYAWTGECHEDLFQVGCAALHKAYPEWNPDRIRNGTKPDIGAFLYMRVEFEIKRFCRVGKAFHYNPACDWKKMVRLMDCRRNGKETRDDAWHMPAREEPSMEFMENSEFVTYCLSKLRKIDREMFIMRHAEEMTYDQIGAVYQLTKERVRQRVKKAREKIAEFLKRDKNVVSQ